MDNNDRLIRIRYALDIKDTDMIEIFRLGGKEITRDDLAKMLIKTIDRKAEEHESESTPEALDDGNCDDEAMEAFFNGFVTFKRGPLKLKPGQKPVQPEPMKNGASINNIMMKKIKIGLALTSDDLHDIFEKAGIKVGKTELTAFFRKEGHKHYRVCGDKYARHFLKGLTLKYRTPSK